MLTLAVALGGVLPSTAHAASPLGAGRTGFVPGEVIVKFKPATVRL